jgi:hypothetical protein
MTKVTLRHHLRRLRRLCLRRTEQFRERSIRNAASALVTVNVVSLDCCDLWVGVREESSGYRALVRCPFAPSVSPLGGPDAAGLLEDAF